MFGSNCEHVLFKLDILLSLCVRGLHCFIRVLVSCGEKGNLYLCFVIMRIEKCKIDTSMAYLWREMFAILRDNLSFRWIFLSFSYKYFSKFVKKSHF